MPGSWLQRLALAPEAEQVNRRPRGDGNRRSHVKSAGPGPTVGAKASAGEEDWAATQSISKVKHDIYLSPEVQHQHPGVSADDAGTNCLVLLTGHGGAKTHRITTIGSLSCSGERKVWTLAPPAIPVRTNARATRRRSGVRADTFGFTVCRNSGTSSLVLVAQQAVIHS